MPALRSATITASYQMLGSEIPDQVMEGWFNSATKSGDIEGHKILDITAIHGSSDFFSIVFTVDAPLDGNQRLSDLFADAKTITDRVVHDTDTVIENVAFND